MFQYSIVYSLEELENFRGSWAALLEKEGNTNPFIEPEWFFSWLSFFKKSGSFEIYIVKYNNEIVAFFPFVHSVRFGIHQFQFIQSDYMDVISCAEWRGKAVQYLFDELSERFGRIIFQLIDLLESQETSRLIESYAIRNQLPYSIFRIIEPKVELTSMDLPEYKRKLRKKVANINRREAETADPW